MNVKGLLSDTVEQTFNRGVAGSRPVRPASSRITWSLFVFGVSGLTPSYQHYKTSQMQIIPDGSVIYLSL